VGTREKVVGWCRKRWTREKITLLSLSPVIQFSLFPRQRIDERELTAGGAVVRWGGWDKDALKEDASRKDPGEWGCSR